MQKRYAANKVKLYDLPVIDSTTANMMTNSKMLSAKCLKFN